MNATELVAAQVGTITLDQIIDWVSRLGLAGAFAAMWWLERQERIATQRALQQLVPDGIKAMTEMTNAFRALRFTLFNGGKGVPDE